MINNSSSSEMPQDPAAADGPEMLAGWQRGKKTETRYGRQAVDDW